MFSPLQIFSGWGSLGKNQSWSKHASMLFFIAKGIDQICYIDHGIKQYIWILAEFGPGLSLILVNMQF